MVLEASSCRPVSCRVEVEELAGKDAVQAAAALVPALGLMKTAKAVSATTPERKLLPLF